jgi:type IV pilus assembly protein PilB
MKGNKNKRLGDLLIEVGLISEEQLGRAISIQKHSGRKIGEILVELGHVSEAEISGALEVQLGITHVELEKIHIPPEVPRLISERLARRHVLIPIKLEGSTLTVAMADPLNIFAIDDIQLTTGLDVKPVISTKSEILNAVGLYFEKESAEKALEEFSESYASDVIDYVDEEMASNVRNAPVVKLLDSLTKQAVKMKASDIHIEPLENNIRIRFRVDGELQEIMAPEKISHSAIVTRIKIMGRMNIAEKRVPQDGRVEMNLDGKDVDMRISIMPTVYGEKVVIRLLDRSSVLMSKTELGFSPKNLEVFDRIIQHPHGIILVTGPTGSGKTTTLYAVLQELNKINRNIITVEDPVEYRLDGVNQSQVNVKAGLTFASGLRSILRQDPDIIMVGEIRDQETAQIAVRAAITGHLVLSTIHTNDSVSTVSRLMDMGIEPFMVSSSVVGIMAQRLVKRICTNCKESYVPAEKERRLLGLANGAFIYRGVGCNACNHTGYRGRTGIHEILPMYDSIKTLVDTRQPTEVIRAAASEMGMVTLRESCKQLVLAGVTTVDELIRMTYSLE